LDAALEPGGTEEKKKIRRKDSAARYAGGDGGRK